MAANNKGTLNYRGRYLLSPSQLTIGSTYQNRIRLTACLGPAEIRKPQEHAIAVLDEEWRHRAALQHSLIRELFLHHDVEHGHREYRIRAGADGYELICLAGGNRIVRGDDDELCPVVARLIDESIMHMPRLGQIAAPGKDIFRIKQITLVVAHRPRALPRRIDNAGKKRIIKRVIDARGTHEVKQPFRILT